MENMNKSREELVLELQNLQKENYALKNKYEKKFLEQKHKIESLELKEEQRNAILHSILSGFLRTDLQGRLLEVNEAYCQMSGYSEQELLKMQVSDLDTIENTQATVVHIQKMKESGGERFESKHRRKDGSIFDVDVSTQYLDTDGGQIVSFVSDITDRKQALNNLVSSKQTFRKVMDNSPIGLALVNPSGQFLKTNNALCEMLGYSEEELIKLDFQSITHPDDLDTDLNFVRQVLNGEIPNYQMEKRYFCKNNSLIWIQLNVSLVRKNDGSPKYLIAQIQNITQKKHTEQDLKESEKKYRLIADNMGNMVTVTDLNLNLTYVSPSVESILGYTPDEYLNAGLNQIITPESMKEIIPIYEEEMQLELSGEANQNRSRIIEIQVYKKDRTLTWLELTSSFIRDKNQHVVGILSVSHDIIERKNNRLELMQRVRMEELFNDISFRFVSGSYLETDGLINSALERLGIFTGVDRVYVFQFENNGVLMSNTHEWCNEGIEPQIENLQQLPVDVFPWWMDKLNKLETIVYENIEDLPLEAAAEQEILEEQDIISILVLPMVSEGKLNGFVGFDSVKHKKAWIDHDVKILNTLSDLISGEIARTKRMKELIVAKQKAEENQNKFKKLSNLTFEGILITDNGIVIDINNSFLKLSGYSSKDLIGKNIVELAVPEKYLPVISKNMKKQHALPYEIEMIRNDGTLIPVEIESRCIMEENSESTARVTAVRDITWRKTTEKEISKLKLAVEQSANTIVITDVNGNIEYVNPKFTEISGYTKDEVRGKNPRILNAGTQPKEYYAEMWKTISAGNTWKGLFNNKKKNGELFWEQVTITPIKNETAEIIHFLAIKEDITALKENEQKLKIQNIELIKAKEKAEESDRLKTAFLTNMSHEIRTPMNGILGFTDLLLETDYNCDDKEEFIKIVHQSGQRMLTTVNDIVEISKIEAGLTPVNKKETDVNESVEQLINFFKPEAERKGLKLILDNLLPVTEKNITTDRNKFDSILSNLIKNAIKFTDSGTVNVGCQSKGPVVEFYIKDTGIGVPKHRQKAIFNRFEQADIKDTRVFQGSGLGLAIAKSYVEMLGGKIWLESREREGSIFYFTIPHNAEPEEKNVIDKVVLAEDKGDKIKNLKILVAEDDEISEMLISIMVEEFSREVIKARTGIEAVEMCHKNPDIGLILLDIQMPGMNGYEATRQIRQFNKDVIIIAQTAFGFKGDREKAIEAGCNDYISKPIKKDELQALIQKYFKKDLIVNL